MICEEGREDDEVVSASTYDHDFSGGAGGVLSSTALKRDKAIEWAGHMVLSCLPDK